MKNVVTRNLGEENAFYWSAEIPQLDGCKAYGPTREAALEALKSITLMWLLDEVGRYYLEWLEANYLVSNQIKGG